MSEFSVVAVLRDPTSTSFSLSLAETIFSFTMTGYGDAGTSNGDAAISCTVSYLSNVLNEEVLSDSPALIIDSFPATGPHTGEVQFTTIRTIGLLSYSSQSQVVNTAIFSGQTVMIPLHHFIVLSNNQLATPDTINCSSSSTAFSLSDSCDTVLLTGSEPAGTAGDVVMVTYNDLVTAITIRVWYPRDGGTLTSSLSTIRPVEGWRDSNCTQQYQPAQVSAIASFSYDQSSLSFTASILHLVASKLSSSHPNVVSVSSNGRHHILS